MRMSFLREFLQLESASGIILFAVAVLALIVANSPLAPIYQQFINVSIFWINEGLMAIFFLLVGLELKRGFLEDEFAKTSQIILPLAAAVGGMLIPALIYLYVNYENPMTIKGWATPVATDIAFALGVLSLFGKRVPTALKLFLLALAIFDDIGAIIIIVLFYSHDMSYFWLFLSAGLVSILFLFNRFKVKSFIPYFIIGVSLWLSLYSSGIHPTISGVILALMIPDLKDHPSVLPQLEETLHPYVAYFIMPLFAFANAGFSLAGLSLSILVDEVVVGIALGLFIGKQIGVLGFSWLLIQLGLARLPRKSTWLMLYGTALLCGIGFTMSLFLGTLSFQNDNTYLAEVRLGVIIGSILSGLFGALVLFTAFAKQRSSIVD